MCAFSIVFLQPVVKIALELLNTSVYMFSKSHLVELVENGFMEPLDDSVGLWVTSFCSSVVDVIKRQVQLKVVLLGFATVLCASVGQYSQHR